MEVKDIVVALKQKVSTEIFDIFIPSIGKPLSFRPINVGEQKSFSKMLLNYKDNPAIIYKSMLGLIKTLCLSKELDFHKIDEIDRMKIIIAMCARNYFFNDIKLPCPKCKEQITLKIDLSKLGESIDNFGDHSTTFEYSTNTNKYSFVIGIPYVQLMSEIEEWVEKHQEPIEASETESTDKKIHHFEQLFSSEDTMKAFVKSFEISNISDETKKEKVDFTGFALKDIIEICNIIPTEIFYSENGVMRIIAEKFLKPLFTLGQDITCDKCQNTIPAGFSLQLFFI
jgi:hypothetical protein